MKISNFCRKCQNDKADHTTLYCPTQTCKNCGGSGHVFKFCPKKETTKKPNSPYESPSPIKKSTTKKPKSPYTSSSLIKKSMNSLTLSQFKELLVITKKYNKRTKLSLPSDENLEINVSPSTSDCSDNVFEVHSLISKSFWLWLKSPQKCQITILSIFSLDGSCSGSWFGTLF